MRGIQTFWRQSRIFKTIAVILPLPLLLLSFLLGGVEVFADSAIPYTNISDNITDIYIEGLTWGQYQYISDSSTNISGTFNLNANNGYNSQLLQNNSSYNGYYEAVLNLTISYRYSFNRLKGYTGNILYYFPLGFNEPSPRPSDLSLSSVVIDSIYSSDSLVNYFRTGDRLYINDLFGVEEYLGGWKYTTFIIKFRVFSYSTSQSYDPYNVNNWKFSIGNYSSGSRISASTINVYESERENFYLYNINSKLDSVSSPVVTAVNNNTNAVNSAASQAHSDITQTQNILQNDSSGFSSGQDAFKSEIDTAQRNADDAVDGAVHSYESDLDTVTDFNWQNFFTAQSSSATFWRDVGEFILDPANLGFISSGLIIVTVIGVFVFALRL